MACIGGKLGTSSSAQPQQKASDLMIPSPTISHIQTVPVCDRTPQPTFLFKPLFPHTLIPPSRGRVPMNIPLGMRAEE